MAIATTMNLNNQQDISFINSLNTTTINTNNNVVKDKQQQDEYYPPRQIHPHLHQQDEDDHQHDLVMPGFRFYPTEEELIEFYLRRKVEGKRFHVELITFLDLYRYDPWELPALASIGEKEWFFYVPRDRKYRNGDRPNRVTTSGYWKATGADRMIRAENNRAIGLKKTLVFYTGKAPKGIRTSWIMNEYRLPQTQTQTQIQTQNQRYFKAEISLCRVYKRAGIEDHPSVPRGVPLSGKKTFNHQYHHQNAANPMAAQQQSLPPPPPRTPLVVVDRTAHITMDNHLTMKEQKEEVKEGDGGNGVILLLPSSTFMGNSSSSSPHHIHHHDHDHSHTLVEHQQALLSSQQQQELGFQGLTSNNHDGSNTTITTPNSHFLFSNYLFSPSSTLLTPSSITADGGDGGGGGVTFSERLWDWNLFPESN